MHRACQISSPSLSILVTTALASLTETAAAAQLDFYANAASTATLAAGTCAASVAVEAALA